MDLDELGIVLSVLTAIFDFAHESNTAGDKEGIDLVAFSSQAVGISDALHWAEQVAKVLNVQPFLLRDVPVVISSRPLGNTDTKTLYTRITEPLSNDLRDVYCIVNKVYKEKSKKVSLENAIVLYKIKEEESVGFALDKSKRYVFKHKGSKRFKMLEELYYAEDWLTVRDLVDIRGGKHNNKEHQIIAKREIIEINNIFKMKTKARYDLILKQKRGSKNVYALNKDEYIFSLKK